MSVGVGPTTRYREELTLVSHDDVLNELVKWCGWVGVPVEPLRTSSPLYDLQSTMGAISSAIVDRMPEYAAELQEAEAKAATAFQQLSERTFEDADDFFNVAKAALIGQMYLAVRKHVNTTNATNELPFDFTRNYAYEDDSGLVYRIDSLPSGLVRTPRRELERSTHQ